MYNYSNNKEMWLFWNIKEQLELRWVYEKSRYVEFAHQINRDNLCEPLSEMYCNNNWRNSKNIRMMLALEILKHIMQLSDKELVHQLQVNIEMQYFCGFQTVYDNTKIESSTMTHFRNRLAKYPEIRNKIQEIHLKETIKKLPKKVQWQFDQDSTVIEENIKYPNDIELLNDVTQLWAKMVNLWKKTFKQFWKFIAKWKRQCKKLYLAYSFGRWKSKKWFEETKETMIDFAEKMIKTTKEWYKKIKYAIYKWNNKLREVKEKIKRYIEVSEKIIKQQKQLLKNKLKNKKQSVKDRIVSLHKDYIRPIVKGKKWKKVQFWAKAHIWLIWWKVTVASWLSRDNEHDSKYIKNWVEIVEKVRWKVPTEVWYDKWWRSEEIYKYLEKKWIENYIQWTKKRKSLKKWVRKRLYNRRAFNENVINDVLNNRWVKNNKYSKNNTEWSVIMGCMASNLIRVW